MTPDTDLQTQAEELDFGKLLARDKKEWHRAYDILVPVAKAAAAAAIHNRTDTEMKSIAYEAILEIENDLRAFVEKGGSTNDLKDKLEIVARRRSIDLWRKDTGARRSQKLNEIDGSVPGRESPEEFHEHSKISQFEEEPFLDAEQRGLSKVIIAWTLMEMERRDPKMGIIHRALVEKFYMQGCTIEQLAEQLQMPKGSVGVTKQRALDRFKEIFASDRRGRELAKLISHI